jgi:regulator of protease activity HflC (stomatin/prohibitin superfamily)
MQKPEGMFIGTPLSEEKKRRWWRFVSRHLSGLSFGLLVVWLIIVVLWPYMVITVPSGEVGVLWYRFPGFDSYCWCFVGRGTVLDPRELRDEGLHLIAPWNKLFIYSLRLQSSSQTIRAISKDGVNVTAQINVRYQLEHNSAAVLHKFIGPDYFSSVVAPEIGAQARQVISQYTAQEVYVSRQKIQDQIREDAQLLLALHLNQLFQPAAVEQPDADRYNNFLQHSILILEPLVLSIELPPAIVAAINQQTEQFYMIQEWKYRVQREAEEAQRKIIEANGIAAFQRTVSQGISDSYLRWRGIEATLALAQSANAKIVIIGSGKDGLPIILGNDGTPAATSPAPPAGASTTAAPNTNLSAAGEPALPGAASPARAANVDHEPAAAAHPRPPNGSGWESVLSRIYGAVRPTQPAPPPGTEVKQ